MCRSLSILAAVAALGAPAFLSAAESNWRDVLRERIPLYGHRNWIVIADSAYPAQSRDGIETIVSGAGQIEVLKEVLAELSRSRHVKPIVHTDRELDFLDDAQAPGVAAYKTELSTVLAGVKPDSEPHEQIISKLDQAGQTFRVLIIKTNMTVPYTSVFLQLDCAYWGPDSERRLRAAMSAQSSR